MITIGRGGVLVSRKNLSSPKLGNSGELDGPLAKSSDQIQVDGAVRVSHRSTKFEPTSRISLYATGEL